MNRVVITRDFVGVCHMQVCAIADATDEEILEVCNHNNPSGTSNGWSKVHRKEGEKFLGVDIGPVKCNDNPGRIHYLVAC